MIVLKEVNKKDYKFLYLLLKEREPIANISHKQMPSWRQHVNFNKSKPYKYDFIIKDENKRVGRLYVSPSNEIGIFIKKGYQGKGYGTKALKIILHRLQGDTVYANIAPGNKKSQEFFKKFGFKLIQYTYHLKVAKKS